MICPLKMQQCNLLWFISVTLQMIFSFFFFLSKYRSGSYQNTKSDITKNQEKRSNQEESSEVNNEWSKNLSCSSAHLCFFFFFSVTVALESISFPFLHNNSCKKTKKTTWTAVCTGSLKNKCFSKIFA